MLMFLGRRIVYYRCVCLCAVYQKEFVLSVTQSGFQFASNTVVGWMMSFDFLRLSFLICRWRGSEDEIAHVNAYILTVTVHRASMAQRWADIKGSGDYSLTSSFFLFFDVCAISHNSSCIKLTVAAHLLAFPVYVSISSLLWSIVA